jgi:hypothetical protein
MTDSVQGFLEQISRSMQKASEGEFIGFILIILGLLLILTLVILVQRASVKKKRTAYSEKSFNSTVKNLLLTDQEEAFLKELSRSLQKGSERKHLLLENAPSFNLAVKRYKEKNSIDDKIVSALRFKLGFISWNPEKPLHSTVELPQGLRLNIKPENSKTFIAKVTEQHAEYFTIKDLNRLEHQIKSKKIRIIFQKADGVYSIETEILKIHSDTCYIKHSEKIHEDIHRHYFRKFISRPVEITKLDRSLATIHTTTYEIGGGGFSFHNTGNKITQNDEIMILLELPPKLKLRMRGTVTKLTHNGLTGHVQFTLINENTRDKIINYLLSLKRSE